MQDEEWIAQLRLGDERAFKLLVERYGSLVYNTVLNILQDADEADDAAQEVFIRVYESIGQFRGECALSTWLYRVAVRKAIDLLRRKKTRAALRQWLPWWMPDERKSATSPFYHPGVQYDKREKASVLFNAIRQLPEKQRIAFTLVKVQGMCYAEASEVMRQGVKAIESLITRAKQNLQEQLQEYKDL